MRAKNREQYTSAWNAHVRDLTTLALAADVPMPEFEDVQKKLYRWVQDAADKQKFEDA